MFVILRKYGEEWKPTAFRPQSKKQADDIVERLTTRGVICKVAEITAENLTPPEETKYNRVRRLPPVKLAITLDADTYACLLQIASQSHDAPVPATPAQMVAQAAFCFADVVRRPGSWEAEVGRRMLLSSGIIKA